MRILNIIQRYPPAVGGSETWCQEICRYLARQGHAVKVLTMDINQEEDYWRDPLGAEECTLALGRFTFDDSIAVRRYQRSLPIYSVYHLVYKRLLDGLLKVYFYGPHSAEMYGKMWREIQRADVVFLHTVPYPHNYVAFVLAKLFRKKTVIVPHFHPTHPHYERSSNYWLLRNCDAVIAVTEFEQQYLQGKGVAAERIFVTANAIHPEQYQPVGLAAFRSRMESECGLRPDDRVITFIGRKTEEKGVGHLIEAVRGLLDEMPAKLFLVGPRFDWYEKLYNTLSDKERKRIIDLGVVSHQDKVNLLHLSNLLALPSRYEAFGIVFLEAWICGVPVLGTDRGAMPSVIGAEGFLSRFEDVEDLRAKLRIALGDLEKLRTMGARGKAKVLEKYTWDVIGVEAEKAVRKPLGNGKDTLKIMVVTNAYPPHFIGGAELIAHAQAKRLKECGHDVVVFTGEHNDRGARHSMRQDAYDGIPVYRVCLHGQDYGADFINFYHERVHQWFDSLLEELTPDVVHFHNVIGLSAGLLQVAKRRRFKTVLTLHDHWGICLKNTLIKQPGKICDDFTRCAECLPFVSEPPWQGIPVRMRSDFIALQLQAVDAFISPSLYLAETYARAGIAREKIHVVWNGIDVSQFRSVARVPDAAKVRFSFVGYLGEHKGLAIILEALPFLEDKDKITINIVGDGGERPLYEEKVRHLGWEEVVKFWGRVDNSHIEQVYRETDVLLLPSIWPENQPVSITEAMAAGIPVIASRIGGIPELVEDGQTGYLIAAGHAEELAHRMSAFVADRAKLSEFGEKAFHKIQNNTLDNQVEKILAIYHEARPRPAPDQPPPAALVVCLGRHVHPACAQALDLFLAESVQPCRVVMLDWLKESQIHEAQVLWIVDPAVRVGEVLIGLRNQLPLLVPEQNAGLKDLCVYGRCGLYYRDAVDAAGGLAYLMQHEVTRQALGCNGFKLFYGSSTVGVQPLSL